MAYPDDTLIGEAGVGDDIDAEEGVDGVLGVQTTQHHAEVPRVDAEAAQYSPATWNNR